MKIFFHKFKGFAFLLLMLAFSRNVNAQCTVTGNVNTSAMLCSSYTGCTFINIGNGTITTNLNFNSDLDLTCLGAIQFIVKNHASINFGSSDKMYLGAGSSIIVESGGDISGSSCNASERIYIGGVLYASCNGQGGATTTFSDIETFGGSGSITTNSPVCIGNTINLSATPPPNGSPFTYTWYDSSNNQIGTGQNISIASATSGTHIYQVRMFSASLNKTMIINCSVVVNSGATTAAPTVSLAQPTCTLATGTITITAPTDSGMKYSINGLTYTNTTGIFTSVAPGTYSVTAKNSSGCISNATSVFIKSATNIWNGSAWSNLTQPVITEDIVFNAFYLSTSDLAGCSCQANADVTINSGHTLTLTNKLTIGNLVNVVFEDGASLVQTNDVINTGNIEYNRSTQSRNSDYTYWSSPVSSLQPLGGVTGLFPDSLNGTFYSFDSSINPADWKNESSGALMTVGKGYIARGPEDPLGVQTPPNTQFTTTFNGVPNNGTINVPILHSGASDGTSNLIGNPYPSAINADLFLAANSSVIDGTLYFWTHNTEIGAGTIELGSGLYPYTGDDYASYNGTGGAAGSGGKIPNGKIAAGQGFFTTSKLASGTATFTNVMRLAGTTLSDGTGVNQQFFKSRNPKVKTTIEKNRIWLNLTNTQGAFKQTLIGYVTNATNDYDSRFDGESFDGNEFVDFYSVNQDKNLVIQGRALPFDENDEVPLGYRTTINGAFTINIDQVDGSLTNQAVYIEDKLTNTVTDLKSGNYTFNTVAGTFNDRFVLRYTNTNKSLATATFDSLENKVLVSNKNKQIKISSFAETIDKVTIYDLLGRQIYQKEKVNSNELSITNLVSSRQTLIVKTVLQNGETVTNKIVY